MTVLYIGNHTSSSKGYAAMARQIIKNEGNTFAFFTRNPRGGKAKAIDETAEIEIKLRNHLIEGLEKISHSILNGDREKRLPGNVNFCFEGIEGESLLLLLDAKGIAASSGSACTSGSLDPSHVLLAIGRPHEIAHGSLRLTICRDNTMEEIDYMIKEIANVVEYLRGISPLWDELWN